MSRTKFKLDLEKEPVETSDPYYDLFDGGYIKPEEYILDETQLNQLLDAIQLIKDFFDAMDEAELMIEC